MDACERDMRGSFGFCWTMAKKENKFIVAAQDLQTLAAVPRIKSTLLLLQNKKKKKKREKRRRRREAITLEEEKITAEEKKRKINIICFCVYKKRTHAAMHLYFAYLVTQKWCDLSGKYAVIVSFVDASLLLRTLSLSFSFFN